MISKLLRTSLKFGGWKKQAASRMETKVRYSSDLVPPNQYDIPIPPRLRLGHVLWVHWEIIPLFVTTAISIGLVVAAFIYAARNKVDVVFHSHNRENISRTMDLRNPTVHKLLTIHQRYDPWPEMADILDKMRTAEKRAMMRAEICNLVA